MSYPTSHSPSPSGIPSGYPPLDPAAEPSDVAAPPKDADRPPEIPVPAFLARCIGKAALALTVLEKVEAALPRMLAELQDAAAAGDASRAGRVAHQIKGSAGNLCAPDLMSAAADFEAFLRSCPAPTATELSFRTGPLATRVIRLLADAPRARAELRRAAAA
jgi:HPt (histidine-containing phosphotransfer) domain-containing protein